MKNKLILTALLFLVGCATPPALVWDKHGTNLDDFNKVRYECMQGSAQATPPSTTYGRDFFGYETAYDINAGNREELFTACMTAKGWQLIPQGQRL